MCSHFTISDTFNCTFQWICHATCWTTGKFIKQVLVLSQNLPCYIYCLRKLTSELFKCLRFHCVTQHHYKPSYEGKQCSYTYVQHMKHVLPKKYKFDVSNHQHGFISRAGVINILLIIFIIIQQNFC